MAKKLVIEGKEAKFNMSLKGAKLPDNFEAQINVKMSFSGATNEQLYRCCASGQSARVALQSQLRAKTVPELKALETNGLKVLFTDVVAGNITKPVDRIMALSQEDFLNLMVEDFEMSQEQAQALYDKKHGVVQEAEAEEKAEENEDDEDQNYCRTCGENIEPGEIMCQECGIMCQECEDEDQTTKE